MGGGSWTGSIWLRIGTVGGMGNFLTSGEPVCFSRRTFFHGVRVKGAFVLNKATCLGHVRGSKVK